MLYQSKCILCTNWSIPFPFKFLFILFGCVCHWHLFTWECQGDFVSPSLLGKIKQINKSSPNILCWLWLRNASAMNSHIFTVHLLHITRITRQSKHTGYIFHINTVKNTKKGEAVTRDITHTQRTRSLHWYFRNNLAAQFNSYCHNTKYNTIPTIYTLHIYSIFSFPEDFQGEVPEFFLCERVSHRFALLFNK